MQTKTELHEIQTKILEVLLFKPKAKFSELNKDKLPSDQISFHIRELIKNGLIGKTDEGEYEMTTEGREFCGRYDTKKMVYEKQPKTSVVVVARKGNKVLTQQRLKSPYFGYFGYITGKIRFGEELMEAAARELLEETGLEGTLRLGGIEQKMDYGKGGALIDDKFFYLIEADNLKGKLEEEFKEGKNVWMTKEEIYSLKDKFHDMEIILRILEEKKVVFEEHKFEVEGF